MFDHFRSAKTAGFTLIELLVVIAIIGVLSALLLSNFVGVRERGSDAALKNNLRQVKTALRLYYNDYQRYPTADNGQVEGCGPADQSMPTTCGAGGEFSAGSSVYIKQLPEVFEYYSNGSEEFLLKVTLGNASDADIQDSQTRCNLANRSSYYNNGTTTEKDYFVCED
jgi:prepilin-type N-terminal cleavage/methylation domain-containing protein